MYVKVEKWSEMMYATIIVGRVCGHIVSSWSVALFFTKDLKKT